MKFSKLADYLFVIAQLGLFALYFWQPHKVEEQLPEIWKIISFAPLLAGFLLIVAAFIQLNRNLTMLPTPVENARLITSGAFKFIRHPIYSGIFLMAFGYAHYRNDFDKLLFSLIILLFFEIKSDYEENKLIQKFEAYKGYITTTGKFFPRFINSIQK